MGVVVVVMYDFLSGRVNAPSATDGAGCGGKAAGACAKLYEDVGSGIFVPVTVNTLIDSKCCLKAEVGGI